MFPPGDRSVECVIYVLYMCLHLEIGVCCPNVAVTLFRRTAGRTLAALAYCQFKFVCTRVRVCLCLKNRIFLCGVCVRARAPSYALCVQLPGQAPTAATSALASRRRRSDRDRCPAWRTRSCEQRARARRSRAIPRPAPKYCCALRSTTPSGCRRPGHWHGSH